MSRHDGGAAARPPGLHLLALEGRAPWELMASLAGWPLLSRAPRGDGHPVLLLPGLGASDVSTAPLRRFLQSRGYSPHRWRLGVNLGFRPQLFDATRERLRALHSRSGRRISLIGWSLGGLYARELAKADPDRVRQVITLGTPFTGNLHSSRASWLYRRLNRSVAEPAPAQIDSLRHAPPVPTTSIFSRSDGIVSWHCSIQPPGDGTESIAVIASHLGLGVNPSVFWLLAERLSQAEADWRPFETSGWRRLVYRTVAN